MKNTKSNLTISAIVLNLILAFTAFGQTPAVDVRLLTSGKLSSER